MSAAYDFLANKAVSQGFGKIKYVRPVRYEEASGLVAEVYRQISGEFLVLPPAMLHSPVPELLAGAWLILRETLLTGQVPRIMKEAVAVGVSEFNACPYCVESHTLMLRKAGASTDMLMIRRDGNKVGALIDWAASAAAPSVSATTPAPFNANQACEIVGTGVAFHYFNRVINVFLDKSPLPLPSALQWMERIMKRLASRSDDSSGAITQAPPAASQSLLPAADLPSDLSWASSHAAIAGAFARMARVIEHVGTTFVPAEVRALINERLESWHGERLSVSRGQAAGIVRDLQQINRPIGILLLFTALASHDVDAPLVAAARNSFAQLENSDQALVGAVAWAAFSAARRTARWLNAGARIPVNAPADCIS
jgi:AhpD family alkylhydroperoxidase